jgi:hypothetical protein
MEGRWDSIKFDDFETTMAPLEKAGLAQGSPLLPIPFASFNADLVDQLVNSNSSTLAYINGYF